MQPKKHILSISSETLVKILKKTWAVIRDIIGAKSEKSQIPDYFRTDNNIVTDNLDIANGFNNFFSQIGPNLASEIPESDSTYEESLKDGNPVSFNFSKNVTS